jgi:hypothetical protein
MKISRIAPSIAYGFTGRHLEMNNNSSLKNPYFFPLYHEVGLGGGDVD